MVLSPHLLVVEVGAMPLQYNTLSRSFRNCSVGLDRHTVLRIRKSQSDNGISTVFRTFYCVSIIISSCKPSDQISSPWQNILVLKSH